MRRLFDERIIFDEKEHAYTFRGVKMSSVTEYLKNFAKEFDTDKHSKSVAEKRGVTQQEILDEWEANKEFALDFGTKIHRYAECIYKGLPTDEATDDKEIAYRSIIDKYVKEHPKLRLVASELVLCSPIHRLAGTADLLLSDGKGKFFLYDWKTSKEINEFSKFKDRLLKPFEYIDDCNFNKYALQLNLYNYMLNKKGIYPQGLYVIHVTKDGYKEYKVPFMEEEVNALLMMRLKELGR